MKNKRKTIIILTIILICVGFTVFFLINNNNEKADKVIIGIIYTGEEKDIAEAIAIKNEKMLFVGSSKEVKKYIGKNTEVTKYENGELICATISDGHTHSIEYITAANDKLCTIEDGATAEECIETIKKYIEENPDDDYIRVVGWNNSAFGELGPTSDLLDTISGDREILASSSDGHSYWVNTKLMQHAGVTKDTADPDGGAIMRYKDGTPSGCLKDTANNLIDKVVPEKSEETIKSGILAADEFNINLGYLVRFQAGENEQADLTKAPFMDYAEELDKEGKLNTYTQASFIINNVDEAVDLVDNAIDYRDKTKGGNFEVTTVKLFLDGIVENEGAYLSESYNNIKDYYGTPRWGKEEDIIKMGKVIAKANAAGMNVHIHTMGDQAISDALKAIEFAADEIGIEKVKEARNALVHLALVKDEDYAKFAKYNVVAVLNPWGYMDPSYYADQVAFLGKERAQNQYPYQRFLNEGINISFGTDFGASFTYDSIECFHVLVTRAANSGEEETILKKSEALTRKQALDTMTKGVAYQIHKENECGTLSVGKYANLTVFSKNLLTIDDSEIMDTKIVKTMYKGEWKN